MVVALSSLKVVVDGDSTGYQQAMDGKATADAKAVASGNALSTSLDQTERRLGTSGTALERLTKSIDPAYASQQRLAQGTATLQRALDSGNISATEHARRLELLV